MLDKIKILIFVGIGYLFLCAIFWHVAYWNTFHINPFEYFQLYDILICFTYPFFLILTGMLGSLLYINFIGEDIVHDALKINRSNETNKLRCIHKIILFFLNRKFMDAFLLMLLCCAFGLWVGFPEEPQSFIILFSVYFALRAFDKYRNPIKYKGLEVKPIFIIVVILLPSLCYTKGKIEAHYIKNNIDYSFIKMNDSTNKIIALKIVGKLGDNVFLLNSDNKFKMIMNMDNFSSRKIYYFNKKLFERTNRIYNE